MTTSNDKTLKSIRVKHSVEDLRKLFEYNEQTGILYWSVNKGRATKGDIAGTNHNKGYLSVQIDKTAYLLHRVIWCIYYGQWPSKFIDHIDLNKKNNKINNLRLATRANNCQNHARRIDSNSSIKGVTWHVRLNKWQARVQIDNKRVHLGYFHNLMDAEKRITDVRSNLHKEFTNHG